jgi:hypothetical protein
MGCLLVESYPVRRKEVCIKPKRAQQGARFFMLLIFKARLQETFPSILRKLWCCALLRQLTKIDSCNNRDYFTNFFCYD